MRKKISFYYEQIPSVSHNDDPREIIRLHIRSFEKYGWRVVLLDESDARKHPLYDVFNDENSVFRSSRNPWEYTRACYMRWLAYAVAGDYFADLDVINYGFTTKDADDLRNELGEAQFISPAAAAGLFKGEEYNDIINTLIDYKNAPFVRGHIETDINDMNIIAECMPNKFSIALTNDVRIARDYSQPGWDTAKLVHYPYHYTKSPRALTIETERPV